MAADLAKSYVPTTTWGFFLQEGVALKFGKIMEAQRSPGTGI